MQQNQDITEMTRGELISFIINKIPDIKIEVTERHVIDKSRYEDQSKALSSWYDWQNCYTYYSGRYNEAALKNDTEEVIKEVYDKYIVEYLGQYEDVYKKRYEAYQVLLQLCKKWGLEEDAYRVIEKYHLHKTIADPQPVE